MLSFRWVALLLVAAGVATGQPPLTTIQDILYRADGNRYTGTMFIRWNSFQAGDTSNIATANVTVPIVNGVLYVQLVPTTTASAGAQYNVTFNGAGRNQFTQVWAVPPSPVKLRVRDVLVSQGTVVGPAPATSQIQISDVAGLANALALLTARGAGFAIGRTAIINQSGQIDGAAGSLGDCVRVDGTSGPCGGGSGGGILPQFSDAEIPAGTINGANTVFTLTFPPSPPASLDLYRNGLLQKVNTDYILNGNSIQFFLSSTPQTGDVLVASYRYGNPNNPLGSLTSAQVICSSMGATTSAATLQQLGSCTIPAGLLGTGDRIEIQFQYSHTGIAAGFVGEIHWANTTVISRPAAAAETAFVGRATFGIYAGAQSWDIESWGNNFGMANGVGVAAADTSQSLTISFNGQMSAAATDSLSLRNFTVIRYPAQVNP
jgi:hypothetical protein